MLLLSDGTVMCQNGGNTTWYRLTPDIHGSYVNGTWTTLAPMHDSRRYYGSQVLRDGRVYVAGGEYGTGGGKMELYDPLADAWTPPMTVPNGPIDSCTETLPDGNVLQGNAGRDTRIYDVTNNSYSSAIMSLGGQDEPSWVKLQDGSFLTLTDTNSERFVPSLNQWVADGKVPTTLFGYGYEIGAALLLPDGKVFYIGGTSHTAIYTPWTNIAGVYTPAGTTNAGTWVAGPDIPNNDGAVDAPAAMLVNGKILCCMANTTTNFGSASTFYEYDYTANSFTQFNGPTGTAEFGAVAYGCTMLDLPDGTVLLSSGSSQVYSYQPDSAPLAGAAPAILSVTTNLDGSFHVTGTQFNGISEGAHYGDDSQMNSDYPVARITNGVGNVLYCRTYNWSTCNLMTGTNVVTTEMTLPAGLLAGTYPLVMTANGIASAPYLLSIPGTPLPPVANLTFTSKSPNQMAFKWSAIGLTEAGYVVQRSTDGINFSALASLGLNVTNYTDNTVTPLGQYYYRVLGTNAYGLGKAAMIFAASPALVSVPAPWQSDDVGAVQGSGAAGTNGGAFTVIASGTGIGADDDEFRFVYQPVVGDVTITARITGSQNSGSNALAGVMIRSSLGSDVAGALMGYDAGTQNTVFEHRAAAAKQATYGLKVYGEPDEDLSRNAGVAIQSFGAEAASTPLWVRLVRSGNMITGYTSTDGTNWTQAGVTTLDALAPVAEVGLAVSSGTYNLLNTSTFDNVTVTGTPAVIPPPLAEWKLDETSGTVAKDAVDSFDGLYENVVLNQPGATLNTDAAVSFNGTNADVSIPALGLTTTNFTITGWVKRSGAQTSFSGLVFSRNAGNRGAGLMLANNGANVELRYSWNDVSGEWNAATGLNLPDGQWAFIALTISPTRAIVYLATNGVVSAVTNNTAPSALTLSGNLYFGYDAASSSRRLVGQMDEVAVYNQTLTGAQIAQLAGAPTIVVASPANGSEFSTTDNIPVTCNVAGTNGHTVNLVQILSNGTPVGQSSVPPYTVNLNNLPVGPNVLTAQLFYDSGLAVVSTPVSLSITSSFAVPYPGLLAAYGPASYWRFGETNGSTTVVDAINGHNGTVQGSGLALGVTGPRPPAYPQFEATNTAAQFNGASNWIACGTAASLAGTDDFTLAAWIKTTAASAGVILQQRDSGFNGEYGLAVNANGTVNFYLYGNSAYQYSFATAQTVNNGQWHFIVAERSGGTNGYLYIDGVRAASATGTPRALDGSIGTYIGRDVRDGVNNFNGQIDEVAIFERALTPTEIAQLANTNQSVQQFTLTYLAGANGTLSGNTNQTVNDGGSGTAVNAVPNTGYHFAGWSDGSQANPRTDSNVTNSLTVTAGFAINTYTLTYTAGAHGSLSGTSPQTVNYGASGTAVTAVPDTGYYFANWSDGSTANPRTDANVTSNVNVTAYFANGLPAPWVTNKIGTVAAATSASYANGAFTVAGAGANISGRSDNFWFVSQSWTGDGTITARLVSEQNTGSAALAGVMLRESTASGARSVFMGLNPNGSAQWVRRTKTGNNSSSTTVSGPTAPYWVRLTRSNNTLAGYLSSDGATWTQVASVTFSLNTSCSGGMAVCSGSSTTLNTSVFDSVSVTNAVLTPAAQVLPLAPAELGPITFDADTARFTVSGATNSVWQLQESSDGVTWSTLQSLTLIDGAVQQSEADDARPMRLFRLSAP